MMYVMVDYPEGKLSLAEIKEGIIIRMLKSWTAGTLHRDVYNAIVSVSSLRKGDLVPGLYLLPLYQKERKQDDIHLKRVDDDTLRGTHWLFQQFGTTVEQADAISWLIPCYIACCLDFELAKYASANMPDYEELMGVYIRIDKKEYYVYPVSDAKTVVDIDIRYTPNFQFERFCKYCGKLYTKSKTGVYCSASCNARFIEQKDWPYENRVTTYEDFYSNNIQPLLEEKRANVSGYSKEMNEAKRKGMTESVVKNYAQQLEAAKKEYNRYNKAAEQWLEWKQREKEKIIQKVEKERTECKRILSRLVAENRLEKERPPDWHVGYLDSQSEKMWAAWNTYLCEEK